MAEQNERDNIRQQAKRCLKCHLMFGNIIFNDMCSKCFKKQKDNQPPKQAETPNLNASLPSESQKNIPLVKLETTSFKREFQRQETQQIKTKKGRCVKCSKKTGMLGYTCKHCSCQFCSSHRLPEAHNCSIDFITLGKKKIKLQNPLICVKKIEEI